MYECCNTKFETLKEFKQHIKSRPTHFLTSSTMINLKIGDDELRKLIMNKEFVASLLNISKVNEEVYVIPLRSNRRPLGSTLKRSIAAKIEGPKYDAGLPTYVIYAKNLVYKVSFRVFNGKLAVLAQMEAEIGRLRFLPGIVMKALSTLPTPQTLVKSVEDKLVSSPSVYNNLKNG